MGTPKKPTGLQGLAASFLSKTDRSQMFDGLRRDSIETLKRELIDNFAKEILASLMDGLVQRTPNALAYLSSGSLAALFHENKPFAGELQESLESFIQQGEFQILFSEIPASEFAEAFVIYMKELAQAEVEEAAKQRDDRQKESP
jgi:hypothetical protein